MYTVEQDAVFLPKTLQASFRNGIILQKYKDTVYLRFNVIGFLFKF